MKTFSSLAIVMSAVLLSKAAYGADTVPPTITVADTITAECAGDTTEVLINPTVSDNADPLPAVTFKNLATGTAITDPYSYSLGSKYVQIRACDHVTPSPNCATRNVTINVTDTTPPQLNVTPLFRTAECVSPNGAPVTITPFATDRCDSTPTVSAANVKPIYPIGATDVTYTATDDSGRFTTAVVHVNVVDTVAPVVNAGQDFLAPKGTCALDPTKTQVTLPLPQVTDTCTIPSGFIFRNSVSGTSERTVCLPDGPTDVVWNVFDSQGKMGTDTVRVTVLAAGDLIVTANGPAGYINSDASITATVAGSSAPSSVTWTIASDRPPFSQSVLPATGQLSALFKEEALYCPVYLSAQDSGGKKGAANQLCFGIDKHVPSFVFNSITDQWVSPADPSTPVPVNPADSNTYPVYFSAMDLSLEIMASDASGMVRSGIQRIRMTLDPGTDNTRIMDKSVCGASPVGTLVPCPEFQHVAGCDQSVEGCEPTTKRLDLGALTLGPHMLRVEVWDQAGNSAMRDYYFRVGDLGDALTAQIAWAQAILLRPTTPMEAHDHLLEAIRKFKTAKALFTDSVGHAFLLARNGWELLDQAEGVGADTGRMKDHLAAAVAAQSRRVLEVTGEQGLEDWRPLREWPDTEPGALVTQERYWRRGFLMYHGAFPVDYQVDVEPALELATHFSAYADQKVAEHKGLMAIDAAINAHDALVMLFTDRTMADMFERSELTVTDPATNDTATEAYYRGSRPLRFGDFIALTLFAQIHRVAFNPSLSAEMGIPAEAQATLREVEEIMDDFSQSVGKVKLAGEDLVAYGFGNKAILERIYLKGLIALEKLKSIQQSSVYTHQWLAAISLTVAFVGNFTLYEGPTALYVLKDDPALYNGELAPLCQNDGTGICDPNAQSSECRYNRIMNALMVGRIRGNVEAAVELYTGSKCLMVDIYNRYYANRFFTALDTPIDPVTYSCGPAPTYSIQAECKCLNPTAQQSNPDAECNGLDDDCDGFIDEDFITTGCGTGACASTSACINGREVPCVPGLPLVTVDLTCDNVDDDCDGLTDEDWISESCGFGGCARTSKCVAGQVQPCVPGVPSPEICDLKDNDCDGAIDEGLDEDLDGYGCQPGVGTCERTDPEHDGCRGTCALAFPDDPSCTDLFDCRDNDPGINPGASEVCDYVDNDCDLKVDEGMTNECGHCSAWCNVTSLGKVAGAIPFNPTPANSDQVVKKPDGSISLATQNVEMNNAWVANYAWGLVSKIDTVTGKEIGRYCSALKSVARGVSNVCGACDGCNSPSRSAVDLDGNVFIANRAHNGGNYQGTMTKIAALTKDCVDINSNGVIDTSKDANNDGIINQADPLEYRGQGDECILWTKKPVTWEGTRPNTAPTGEGYFLPRALAVDKDGDVWLGNWQDQGFWEINPTTGAVKRWVSFGIPPYGGVMDGRGILWAPENCCGDGNQVYGLNTTNATVTLGLTTWAAGQVVASPNQPWSDKGGYGIGVDGKGRVWIGSYPQESWAAARYDPSTKTWSKALVASPKKTSAGMGRGLTVDNQNRVWVAQHGGWNQGRLTAYNGDTLAITHDVYTGTPGGRIPIGVGIGANGRVWTANRDSSNLTVYDPTTTAVASYPTGGSLGNLYTYSDFTGNMARTFTAPKGSYREIIEGCADHQPVNKWLRLTWTGDVPAGTHVKFRIRVSPTMAGLATATWYPPATAWEVPSGGIIDLGTVPAVLSTGHTNIKWSEVEVIMESGPDGAVPLVYHYSMIRNCVEF